MARPRNDERRKRVPLGTLRRRLSAPERPGYVRRWINDKPGRLMQAQEGGYEFVTDQTIDIGDPDVTNEIGNSLDSRISRVVDRGTGMRAFLMEIKEEWYVEDKAEQQRQIDELEEALSRGIDEKGGPGVDGRYIPGKSNMAMLITNKSTP